MLTKGEWLPVYIRMIKGVTVQENEKIGMLKKPGFTPVEISPISTTFL